MTAMNIHMLVLQRRCSYPGELAPEVMLAVDEWTMSDNPDYYVEQSVKLKAEISDEAQSWADIVVQIDRDAVDAALNPSTILPGTIVG